METASVAMCRAITDGVRKTLQKLGIWTAVSRRRHESGNKVCPTFNLDPATWIHFEALAGKLFRMGRSFLEALGFWSWFEALYKRRRMLESDFEKFCFYVYPTSN